MKKNKGFTLIELLVVIAIIGILSAVVLASLNTARDKGKDASAKASMSSIRASAEIYYNGTGANSYGSLNDGSGVSTQTYTSASANTTAATSLCTDTDVTKLGAAADGQVTTANLTTCSSRNNSYTVVTQLNNTTYFCVDSTGFAGDPSGTGATAAAGTAMGTGIAAGWSSGVKCK